MEQEIKIGILLVDDSPDQRREILSVLNDPRLDIVEAESGQAGLELLRENDFAVVLIDVRMPGMSGFELAEHIRSLEPARVIPVIFITASQAADEDLRKGYSLGAVDFLSVPVVPEILRAKVEVFAEIFHRKELLARQAKELEAEVRTRTAELNYQNAVTKSLTDIADSGQFVLDQEKRIRFMNPSAEKILGRKFDEVKGRTLHGITHDPGTEGRPCASPECLLEKALESAMPVRNLGETFLRRDGRRLSVSCSIAPLHTGGETTETVVEFRDVTEHKLAEDLLKLSEDRYRRLFETAQDGILILDAEAGRIFDVNPFLAQLLGYSKEELVGKELWEIGLFGDIEASRVAFRTLRDAGYVRYDDLPLQTKDGRRKEVEFVSNAYRVGGETVLQCNIRDVSDRKLMESALRRTEADLRQAQKTEALGKLSGGIAHDFNNLLTAVIGYSDLCLSMADEKGLMREYLEEILKAGQRAANLTQQLLAFSRKQVLAPKLLDLNGTVGDILNMLRRLIGENVRLKPQLDSNLWRIKADPVQINQALLNLVNNARDALPQGGEIIIRTRNVETVAGAAARNSAPEPRQYVILSVSDNGTGIDSAVMSRIFEPFFTTKEFGKGSGMGLAMVDGFVKQSGGHITVESNPGKGSTFTVYLPRVQEEEKAGPSSSPTADLFRGTETILMAEDEPMVRTFTRKILEMHGYVVLEAEDGETALGLCSKYGGSISLLLTDILMPGMNGRELADRFKLDYPRKPVLFMSGYIDEVVVEMGLLEEGTPLIQKPFAPGHLIQAVRKALDGIQDDGIRTLGRESSPTAL